MSTSKTYQQSLADAGSENRPPMLERGSYIPWASRFRRYLNRKRDNRKWLLKALDEGPYEFKNFVPEGSTIPRLQTAKDLEGDDLLLHDAEMEDLEVDDLLLHGAEMEVMNMILLSIPNEIYNSVDACTLAKDMWKRVERLIRGTIQNRVDRETRFMNKFDQFVAEPREALVSVYNCFAQLMNDLERNNMNFPTVTINTKFLNSLQPEWLKYVTQVRRAKQLTVDSFDDLFDYLQQFEKLVNASRAKKLEKSHDPLALVANTSSSSRQTSSYYVTHPTSVVDYDDEYQQDDVHNNFEDPIVSAMLLLAKAITQNFSNPTNNRLRASPNTRNQAIIQGDRVNIQRRNSGNTRRNKRRAYVQEEVVEGMNALNETRNVQRILRTPSSGNTSTDEAGVILTDEQNDFLFVDASRMEEIEELSANICLMARIQPADHTSDDGPSNIKFDSFKGNVNSGSVEKNTHVPDLCAVEKLARNAYQEAEKQQIFAQQVQKQNTHLTRQLEMYKERVRILESINKDNNYLNEFLEADERAKRYNKQAQSQLVHDRDIIRDLKKQRDKLDLDGKNYKRKNEELQKTHSILKRQMSEKEDTYHDTILDLEAKLKKNVDMMLKLGNSLQGMFMLGPKPLSMYDQQLKHGLGYPNPYTLKQVISKCPKLYVASSLGNLKIPLNVRDSEDTLKDAFKKIQINDFCQDQVKPILNELKVYLEFFWNLFQRDIKEMKDVFESTESELDELEKQNDLLKDQLLEASLKHDVELCVLINHECVEKILSDELDQVKKKSFEIQAGLQSRIKILEKDVQRCQKQSVDFELKLQHEKEKHKWDSTSRNKNTNPLDYSWISKLEKLENENVSLDFKVQSLIKERDNVKIEYQKLFDSIKKTRSQTQKEMDELIVHVSEKTYAYGAIRVDNQDLLSTISELKTRLENFEKGMNATSRVRRPMSRDSHVAHSILDNSNKAVKNVSVYVRKNKQKDNTSANVILNKENVIDVDVANASKAKTLLCVSCMKNVLFPCHDKCLAKHKLNVLSNVRRTFSTNSRTPKSLETTYVAPKTRFSKKETQSKTLDTTFVVSKTKIDVESASNAKDKVSSASRIKKTNLRDKPLSTFIKNKIRTSRIWQKWFESQPNVIWTPVNIKPNVANTRSSEKPSVSIKKWVVNLPNCPSVVSSCVAGLGHNLFSIGQFCDGDLEVAFRSNTWYVRSLEGNDLLTGGRDSNLYTISISDMDASPPVYLMYKGTSTKSCSNMKRITFVLLVKGEKKKASHPPKLVPSDHSKLELLHMDLCGPIRVASINGKKYILVIVDDFSRYTWVYFLRSKDETPEIIKKFITQAQLNYKAKVCKIHIDNGTEFKNTTLKAYYETLGIMQQFSIAQTPQQNGVVERHNRTLVEAARTMLIVSKLPEFLWAEAVPTACFTQNRSIIHTQYNKTSYELLRGRKLNIAYFHMFGSLFYPTNDHDDLGKMKPKADIGVFIGYSETSIGFRIYNRRTKMIMETIHVKFDELTAMASEHDCLEPELQ
ncbi:retrovirus-related pol polyprotein from transposon TNT 1-94 [Tanacetum coccineum]